MARKTEDWVNIYQHRTKGYKVAECHDNSDDAALELLDGVMGSDMEYVKTLYECQAETPFPYSGSVDLNELAREIEQKRRETAEHERQERWAGAL